MRPPARLIPLCAVVFSIALGVTLAVVIGQRLPPAALPVIAGLMIGAGVAVPTTLLFAGILTSDNLRLPKRSPYTTHPHVVWFRTNHPPTYTAEPHPVAFLVPPNQHNP